MHANERIWHKSLVSGNILSSNPYLKPDIACTWGVGLDIIRCIIAIASVGFKAVFFL